MQLLRNTSAVCSTGGASYCRASPARICAAMSGGKSGGDATSNEWNETPKLEIGNWTRMLTPLQAGMLPQKGGPVIRLVPAGGAGGLGEGREGKVGGRLLWTVSSSGWRPCD